MRSHHLPATPGTVCWGFWDGSLPPVLTIASGDTVTIDTLSGEPPDLPDAATGFAVLPEHREVLAEGPGGPGPHFLTGPIAIAGAKPGDVLEVRIHKIEWRQDWGWNLQVPLLGTLPEDFPELRRIHVPLDRSRNSVCMPWGQELALKPFFGNFGVAPPPQWGRLSSKEPRAFGGNMDNKELGVGTTVYFPVFVEGALFSAGDGHALQGDGEVCLTAIETALTGTFEFIVRTDMKLTSPRAEQADAWITMGFDEDLDDAVKHALRDMIKLNRRGFARHADGGRQQRHPLRVVEGRAAGKALGCRRHGGRQSPWLSLNGRDRIADFGDTESPLAGVHEFRKEQ